MIANLEYREGRPSDLRATFELAERSWHASRAQRGELSPEHRRDEADEGAQWERERGLLEFTVAQPGSYWLSTDGDDVVGYARVVHFEGMDELTDMWVAPSHMGQGVGRALLSRCWPGPPSPELGRLAVTLGMPADLSLYTDFGVMPIAGHWHLRHRAEDYLERRAQERDVAESTVVALKPERAVEEWKRLEPPAICHERPQLHEFFGRTRVCLARMDASGEQASAVCWVSSNGDIGPAVAATAADLVPVVLAALDRVAKAQEPESLDVFCTTDSWWLLDRLRRLGFRVHWPRWAMCSIPLPGLDRYLPTRPPLVL